MSEPPIGIEPMTYALREARSRAAHTLAAPIARIIAVTALAALGLSKDPFHEPFHARGLASRRPVDPRLSHAYRGLANCGKARQLGMTVRHGQPVAG